MNYNRKPKATGLQDEKTGLWMQLNTWQWKEREGWSDQDGTRARSPRLLQPVLCVCWLHPQLISFLGRAKSHSSFT